MTTSLLVTMIVIAIGLLSIARATAGERPGGAPPAGDMMINLLKQQAHRALEARRAQYEKIKTPEQIAAWQDRMRKTLLELLGPLPERTPLNAKVTGKEDRDGYRVEKVLFESRPGFFVTSILYLPLAKPPHPAVLVPCGHSKNGKAYESYQKAPILLARSGLAAFCFDPIGQGERSQVFSQDGTPLRDPTLEHTLVGAGSILLGESVAAFFVWDGIRAIDYLVSRDDIDPTRIGCTGTSGGGTQTSYLMSIDPRITCAVVCCYLTSFERLIATAGPQDAEQHFHNQIGCGLNHAEFAIMQAPRPLLFGTATRDFFDIEGSWDTFRQAKRIYSRLDVAERVDIAEADLEHNFARELREPMARWMRRWLCGIDEAIEEADARVASDEAMHCTLKGQVGWPPGAKSAFDLNSETEVKLARNRAEFWKSTPRQEALQRVRQIVGVLELHDLPEPAQRVMGMQQRDGFRITEIVLQCDTGIMLPAALYEPAGQPASTYLYLDGQGMDSHTADPAAIEELVRAGNAVFDVDLPGIGRTRGTGGGADRWATAFGPNVKEFFLAYMLGKSYVGIRTEAILTCARFLSHRLAADKPNPVHLVSIGEAGPAALHAAALEPDLFASVELRRSLSTWTSVVRMPMHRNQLINVVQGALKMYDLPDLVASLPATKITIVEPTDATGSVRDDSAAT